MERMIKSTENSLPSSETPQSGGVTVTRAAELLSVRRETVYRWLQKGAISCYTEEGRRLIPLSEIEAVRGQPLRLTHNAFRGGGKPPERFLPTPPIVVVGDRPEADVTRLARAFSLAGRPHIVLGGAVPVADLLRLAEHASAPTIIAAPEDAHIDSAKAVICDASNIMLAATDATIRSIADHLVDQWRKARESEAEGDPG